MVIDNLKSCPFCGGLPVLVPVLDDEKKFCGYVVSCTRCKSSTPAVNDEFDAVTVWNNRAPNERENELEKLLANLVNAYRSELHSAGMRTRAIHQAEDFLKSNAD